MNPRILAMSLGLGFWSLDLVSTALCLGIGGARVAESNPLFASIGWWIIPLGLLWVVAPMGLILLSDYLMGKIEPRIQGLKVWAVSVDILVVMCGYTFLVSGLNNLLVLRWLML